MDDNAESGCQRAGITDDHQQYAAQGIQANAVNQMLTLIQRNWSEY